MPKKMKALPKTFRGAKCIRGKGMKGTAYDKLVEEKGLDQFDATKTMYLVVEDRGLESGFSEPRAFFKEADAIRCAQANANGNVDQRVLTVIGHTLVVATDNEL